MSQISGTGSSTRPSASGTNNNSFNDVNIDDFLALMIAELQNQDPLNPLDNDELVAQIGQIREIGATQKLTETLDSVLLGQNIASATNLIGAEIDAVSDDKQRVTGLVERVSVADGQPKLHLDVNPRAATVPDKGNMEAGKYEYRVVWQDSGKTFAVDPLASVEGRKLEVAADGSAALLTNLPKTASAKQVFRREAGEKDFRLVGQINDVNASSFLDVTATDDLSQLVLSGSPELINPKRSFTVSLKNVGEIRSLGVK